LIELIHEIKKLREENRATCKRGSELNTLLKEAESEFDHEAGGNHIVYKGKLYPCRDKFLNNESSVEVLD
jgi:hypothetical protein